MPTEVTKVLYPCSAGPGTWTVFDAANAAVATCKKTPDNFPDDQATSVAQDSGISTAVDNAAQQLLLDGVGPGTLKSLKASVFHSQSSWDPDLPNATTKMYLSLDKGATWVPAAGAPVALGNFAATWAMGDAGEPQAEMLAAPVTLAAEVKPRLKLVFSAGGGGDVTVYSVRAQAKITPA